MAAVVDKTVVIIVVINIWFDAAPIRPTTVAGRINWMLEVLIAKKVHIAFDAVSFS